MCMKTPTVTEIPPRMACVEHDTFIEHGAPPPASPGSLNSCAAHLPARD
jgi:hypothetical protein